MTALISVAETLLYEAKAAKLMTEAERDAVVDTIAADPEGGVLVKGTGGLRKLRIPLAGQLGAK